MTVLTVYKMKIIVDLQHVIYLFIYLFIHLFKSSILNTPIENFASYLFDKPRHY